MTQLGAIVAAIALCFVVGWIADSQLPFKGGLMIAAIVAACVAIALIS